MISPATPILPRTHILSYISKASSPTRIRVIASHAVLVMGIVYALAAFLPIAAIYREVIHLRSFSYFAPGPPYGPSPFPVARSMSYSVAIVTALTSPRSFGWPLLLLLAVTGSVLLIPCAGAVRQGRPWACWISFGALAAGVPPLALLTAGIGSVALSLGVDGRYAEPIYLLWFIPCPLLILTILLLLDVLRFLRWIARNPFTEKPPAHFLPKIPSNGPTPLV